MNIFRTMIIPDAIVVQARSLADSFGPAASGMWTTALSPTGTLPATHWISSGYIGDDFAAIMPFAHEETASSEDRDGYTTVWVGDPYDPAAFIALAEAAGATSPPVEVIMQIMSVVDVSDQPPFVAMDRLGLKMMKEPL